MAHGKAGQHAAGGPTSRQQGTRARPATSIGEWRSGRLAVATQLGHHARIKWDMPFRHEACSSAAGRYRRVLRGRQRSTASAVTACQPARALRQRPNNAARSNASRTLPDPDHAAITCRQRARSATGVGRRRPMHLGGAKMVRRRSSAARRGRVARAPEVVGVSLPRVLGLVLRRRGAR